MNYLKLVHLFLAVTMMGTVMISCVKKRSTGKIRHCIGFSCTGCSGREGTC